MYEHLLVALLLLLAGLGIVMYRIIMSPEMKYHSFWYRIKAKTLFFFGRIRRLENFPWVTWAVIGHKIDYRDVRKATAAARPGDVGLHTDGGFLINCGIPGTFKHAWIVVDDHYCVEANQNGVLHRDEMFPLASDYAVLLRPKGVTPADVSVATGRAKSIVGCEYDANFKFNLEEADEELKRYTRNIFAGKFHQAFSCTETVAFAWYHKKDELSIFRTVYAGREAIVADDYLRMHFDVVWASPSVTPEWLKKSGMHEQGRAKIAEFLAKK